MDKEGLRLRDFVASDVEKWLTQRGGTFPELVALLRAPRRCERMEVDPSVLNPYVSNYGSAIRIAVEKEGSIAAIVTLADIDFLTGKAVLLWANGKRGNAVEVRPAIAALRDWYEQNTAIRHVTLADGFAGTDDGLGETGGKNAPDGAFFADVPSFCITNVTNPREKKYVLRYFDKSMFTPMSQRGNGEHVVSKIAAAADFLLAYDRELLGFVAFYDNDVEGRTAFISSIVVDPKFRRRGIARRLFLMAAKTAHEKGMNVLRLKVSARNLSARELYALMGMQQVSTDEDSMVMEMRLS